METHARTLTKALTWRMMALVMTTIIAWAVTGRAEVAAAIGLADTVVKVVMYYLHERLWLRVKFGRLLGPPPARGQAEVTP